MMQPMSSKKEESPPLQSRFQHHGLFHAMRNGTLYRSIDGVNWEIETDPDAPDLAEGTSRMTRPTKESSQKR
jgi:hypothetical protein